MGTPRRDKRMHFCSCGAKVWLETKIVCDTCFVPKVPVRPKKAVIQTHIRVIPPRVDYLHKLASGEL